MLLPRRQKQSLTISVIPLINVIFLLLIFFMLAGRVESLETYKVDAPSVKTAMGIAHKETLILVTKNEKIAVGEDPVLKEDFLQIIETLIARDKDIKLHVKVDKATPSTMLLWVVATLEKAGAKDVALLVEQAG